MRINKVLKLKDKSINYLKKLKEKSRRNHPSQEPENKRFAVNTMVSV